MIKNNPNCIYILVNIKKKIKRFLVIFEMLEYFKNNFSKLQTEILQKKGFSLLQKILYMLKT